MDNNNKQKYEDMQKSARGPAKSGAEMAKHAEAAMKTGVNIAAAKNKDAMEEKGAKVIKQAKETVSAGVNVAAGKMESVAAESNSQPLKKAAFSRKKTLLLLAGTVIIIVAIIMEIGGGDSGVKIASASEAEKYALKHISKNVTYAAKINETPGYELFALANIDERQSTLRASSVTGEPIEGYLIYYSEGYGTMFNVIVTYDGDIYFYLVGSQSSNTTAGTALYTKMYDAKKGWG